jgi:superfamily I DNA/RNA helicase
MKWLLIPQTTISELIGHQLRAWIGVRLPADLPRAFRLEFAKGHAHTGRVVAVDENTDLLVIWPSREPSALDLRNVPVISIWSEPDEPTIWAVGEADRSQVLERICQLAARVWSDQTLPIHWAPKKVEGFHSVYVSGRQLVDLRVAYVSAAETGRQVLNVGSLYTAWKHAGTIRVPTVDASVLAKLPHSVDPPGEHEIQDIGDAVAEEEDRPDTPDLVMALPGGESHHLFSLQFSDWTSPSGPLTKEQRRVIAHKVLRPLRIHGPAGSGKTLVLILKALGLLHQAQDANSRCKVLVVAHSTAMRNTIRTAMETIDDRLLMATKKEDPQFLDVETLHGWCIRELGLEYGPRYVLEIDPTVSRQQQKQMLDDVLNNAFTGRYSGYRALLSKDFCARLDGDRERLLRDLGSEIAIRIKGRGFGTGDLKFYAESPLRSFIGKDETLADRHFVFHLYQSYVQQFVDAGLLDTDDVVLSMANRLTTPLWDRQRKELGYDYVMVDETHLFNENERRVLPYLTRGTTRFLPLVMTFDEAQSIGGRRSIDLSVSGIEHSERRNLKYVHRSSPDIFQLARYYIERSPLIFTEFGTPSVMMGKAELRRCKKPTVVYGEGDTGVLEKVSATCNELRDHNYQRIGIIVFDLTQLDFFRRNLAGHVGRFHYVRERGELEAAAPNPGIYLMTPDACGGLEFDAVILVGVDEGITPPPIGKLSAQGYLSLEEEAFTELYTATTRAKYRLVIVSDSRQGLSSILQPALSAGLLVEEE